jgi:excisionase family DNA binding protein
MVAKQNLLTIPEVAQQLAIKESTVRAWILTRRLGRVKVGRRAVRVPASEVDRLIAEGLIPARREQ